MFICLCKQPFVFEIYFVYFFSVFFSLLGFQIRSFKHVFEVCFILHVEGCFWRYIHSKTCLGLLVR